ncbi:PLP-dependent aminotransferase family protein [Clostridiisalibacter paucivorans]|uniref:aminotransferase-like domain-containing protein n=1 Tax=Clostridiisalibacter paucivorans TaxID=408753 RepID=UPI00047EB5DA|nr:PLP-dependent aminotransferase family protein [Clostridiisalibacter paucivorans]
MTNINWKPNRDLDIPVYRQIIDYIKDKISDGEWDVGFKLPTQRQLATLFDVNRSTIIEALDELKGEGIIESRGSGGTIIVNNTWSLLTSTPPPNWYEYIEAGIHRPNLPTIQLINKLEYHRDIIRLGTGELSPELFPREMFSEVLMKISKKIYSLGYEEPKGLLYLRKVLSEYLKRYGIYVSPESILIVSGSLQALQLISLGILHPGSRVFIENLSYLKSLHVFQSAGMNLKGISMDNQGAIPNEVVSRNRNNMALLYTIPTFHNPTGITMTKKRREEILKRCESERVPIIEDDVYRELWLDKEPPNAIKSMDSKGIVLYMGSISKSLSAGLRIGWLVGPESVIERLGDIKMQTDYGSSSLAQWALAHWIDSGLYDEYLHQVRKELRIRRKVALEALDKYFSDIATWQKPKGGFYIWTKLNKKVSINNLFSEALKENLLINPGKIYGFSNNQYLRISYSYASLSDLDKGLKRLAFLVKKASK